MESIQKQPSKREFTALECAYYGFFMEDASLVWKQKPEDVTTRQVTELLTIAKSLEIKFLCSSQDPASCSRPASKIIVPIEEGRPKINEALFTCGDEVCIQRARMQLPGSAEVYDFTLEGSYELFNRHKNPDILHEFGMKLLQAWELASSSGIVDEQKVRRAFWSPYDGFRVYLASYSL